MEIRSYLHKKNRFSVDGNIVTGFDSKNRTFLLDLENIHLLDEYCWVINSVGYAVARVRGVGGLVFMQNVIMDFVPNGKKNNTIVDHIDRNPSNNLMSNLRFGTISQNNYNKATRSDSTSDVTGVSETEDGTWHYYLQVNGKRIGGRVKTYYQAVQNRLLLEKEYCGEFSPQRHLFSEYGIED